MKKVYTKIAHVTQSNPTEFYDCVNKTIGDMQSKGVEVEVQYQTGRNYDTMFFTALILGYVMEDC